MELRKSKNLKQSDISNTLGIAQSSYSRFESGQYNLPIDLLVKLCNILDVSVSWLIGEDIVSDLTDEERLIMESFKRSIKRLRKK
jgi:transcriptional regulator with XRE-family HTH domain